MRLQLHMRPSTTFAVRALLTAWGVFAVLAPCAAHADDEVSSLDFSASTMDAECADEIGAVEVEDEESAVAAPPCERGDVDADGVCDEVEAASGTKVLRADTDADGVPDGLEDANRDGVVDPGETDPRVPGLFPGTYPHIPEPMAFDLVRGLGANKGEVEVNNLAVFSLGRGRRGLAWAPEIEWAFAHGLAVELELPMHNRELEALKGALQATFPNHRAHLIHGVQIIGEYRLSERHAELTALYLMGGRANQWSMLAMLGARAVTPMDARADYEALFNPSVYNDLTETLTVGVETNIALGAAGRFMLAIIPQVHWQISTRARVQVGGGARLDGGDLQPLIATRLVLE